MSNLPLQSYLSVLSGLVHGNFFPIILFQFTFTNKYNVMIIPVILRTIAIMIDIGLSVFVNSEITRWTNGLPKSTPIHTMDSLYKNSPANTATANFHGLYLVRPNVMYMIFPVKGVTVATNAPIHPYLARSF